MQAVGEIGPGEASCLALFIQNLVNEGRAVVFSQPLEPVNDATISLLEALDKSCRAEAALDLPEFSGSVALWAATLLYQLCQFTACRDIGEEQIHRACSIPCPEGPNPSSHWSADLTFRHLPRLFQMARHLSNADPLLAEMKRLAAEWPLSSVGMTDLAGLKLDPILHDPALKRLYADRIITAADVARLEEPGIRELLRQDLGIHPQLSPLLAEKLQFHQTTSLAPDHFEPI
jgi:hypothetical protein